MATALPWGAPLTEDDLAAMPEDGHRYELVDGVLLVTPAPSGLHQRCVVRLTVLLEQARSAGHELLVAPYDVRLSRTTVLEPDLLVFRKGEATPARLERAPLLAVEVLSPSTRRLPMSPELRQFYKNFGPEETFTMPWTIERLRIYSLRDLAERQTGYRWTAGGQPDRCGMTLGLLSGTEPPIQSSRTPSKLALLRPSLSTERDSGLPHR